MHLSRATAGFAFLFVFLCMLSGCQTTQPAANSGVATEQELTIARNIASGPHVDTSDYLYDPSDKSCDGYPRLKVETAPGTCLGLVMPKERAVDQVAKKSFSMPRTLVQVPGTTDFLVADMGSWHMGRGALFRMSKDSKGLYQLTLLKSGMNFPHSVKIGPDGKFWVNELKQISRFTLSGSQITSWEVVVDGLPATVNDSHPLSQFTFDPRNNDLYTNSGSPSDSSAGAGKKAGELKYCPQVEDEKKSAILKISAAQLAGPLPVKTWQRVATGLRNSMALTIHPSGMLVQGENARDFASLDEPYEEMNAIDLNRFTPGQESDEAYRYGWPYCYDFHATSPEWVGTKPLDCGQVDPSQPGDYQKPYTLIPPHAAPLAAGYYKGAMFGSALDGKLLMTWHGYNPTGHRLVAYNVGANGLPVLGQNKAAAAYSIDRGQACQGKKRFAPDGGLDRYASYVELITKWNEKPGQRPRGAPTGFTIADDGSIWIAEDKNQTIVRLAKDSLPFVKETCDGNWDERILGLVWRRALVDDASLAQLYGDMKAKMTTKYCAACHGGLTEKSIADDDDSMLDYLNLKTQWFRAQNPDKSRALQAIQHVGSTPPMPPVGSPNFFGTAEGDEIIKTVRAWVGAMPTDIDSRYAKTTLKSSRKIRQSPSASGKVCGQLPTGAVVYIDPRSSTFVKADGWKWARVYLTQDQKVLTPGACVWPIDGVYYLATQSL